MGGITRVRFASFQRSHLKTQVILTSLSHEQDVHHGQTRKYRGRRRASRFSNVHPSSSPGQHRKNLVVAAAAPRMRTGRSAWANFGSARHFEVIALLRVRSTARSGRFATALASIAPWFGGSQHDDPLIRDRPPPAAGRCSSQVATDTRFARLCTTMSFRRPASPAHPPTTAPRITSTAC